MGIVKPADIGFDIMHINLHKTFSTPHGGGGPGSGPICCKKVLEPFLPVPVVAKSHTPPSMPSQDGVCENTITQYFLDYNRPLSIGRIKNFYGNFGVLVKALTYIIGLGGEGLRNASRIAVLNANYMKERLAPYYDVPYDRRCMHEFVVSLQSWKDKYGVTALDVAKALIDYGIHPPTIYFPLIVPEALMFEPAETESKETIDRAIDALLDIYDRVVNKGETLKDCPKTTPVGRPDEITAARKPVVKCET
jgi:glycine dehydrogenase subunit 2